MICAPLLHLIEEAVCFHVLMHETWLMYCGSHILGALHPSFYLKAADAGVRQLFYVLYVREVLK